jgi:hypothetical protein
MPVRVLDVRWAEEALLEPEAMAQTIATIGTGAAA